MLPPAPQVASLSITKSLILGIFTALPLTLLSLFPFPLPSHPSSPLYQALLRSFLHASLPEESLKLLSLFLLSRYRSSRHLPWTLGGAALRGFYLGLGFAAVECCLYLFAGGWTVTILRLVTAVPAHGFLGAIMGHYLARFAATAERRWLAKALLVPSLLHGIYDFPLMVGGSATRADALAALLLSVLVLGLLAAWSLSIFAASARRIAIGSLTTRVDSQDPHE